MYYVRVKKSFGRKKAGTDAIYPNNVAVQLAKKGKVILVKKLDRKKLRRKVCKIWESSLTPRKCLSETYQKKLEKLAKKAMM